MHLRHAVIADTNAVLELLKEAYARSKFVNDGQVDEDEARRFIRFLIQRHSGKGLTGTWCMLAEHDDKIVGLHFGAKDRIKGIGDKFYATDVWFYTSPGAPPIAAVMLLKSFLAWTLIDERIVRIIPGADNTIGNYEDLAAAYKRLGFEQCGAIFDYRIDRAQKGAA